jgi:hypothetical protein
MVLSDNDFKYLAFGSTGTLTSYFVTLITTRVTVSRLIDYRYLELIAHRSIACNYLLAEYSLSVIIVVDTSLNDDHHLNKKLELILSARNTLETNTFLSLKSTLHVEE